MLEFKNGIHNIRLINFVLLKEASNYAIVFRGVDDDGLETYFSIPVDLSVVRGRYLWDIIEGSVPKDIRDEVTAAIYEYIDTQGPYAFYFLPYIDYQEEFYLKKRKRGE